MDIQEFEYKLYSLINKFEDDLEAARIFMGLDDMTEKVIQVLEEDDYVVR